MLTTARYWREQPQRYRYEAGRCAGCGEIYFPPRRVCAKCGGREFSTEILPTTGTVDTFTVIRVAPTAFTDQAPYAVGLVTLENGVKILTQIVDCDPGEIEIGMPVRMEFRKIFAEGEAGMIAYGYKCVPA